MALKSLRSLIRYYEGEKQPDDVIIPPEEVLEAREYSSQLFSDVRYWR